MRLKRTQPPQTTIEPGLIGAFRFFTILRLVIGTTIFSVLLVLNRPAHIFVYGIVVTLLMLGYLSYPVFQRRLGRYFLPIGLMFDTANTLTLEFMVRSRLIEANIDRFQALAGSAAPQLAEPVFANALVTDVWQVSPPLFFLLIFISWQYSFREVVLFSLAIAMFDLLFPITIGSLNPDSEITYNLTFVTLQSITYIMSGYLVTRLVEAQRRQRQELSEAKAKLTNYATMVESLTISRERNHMARELHDTLAHTLSAATVQLEAVNSLWDAGQTERAHGVLQRALGTTRNGLKETRRALQSLRASPIEDLGLRLALHELGDTTQRRLGSNVKMNLPDEVDLEGLPAEVEQTIYRVAQEALENIVRHAYPTQTTIHLTRQNGIVRLTVTDNGCGFDLNAVDRERKFGLRGMAERVDAMGGQLAIYSKPEKGTQIQLTLKVKDHDPRIDLR
jgi:signal transduction histidine kinase